MKAQFSDTVKYKICKLCNEELPIVNYWKHPNTKDGYFNKCKICALKVVDKTVTSKQKLLEKNIWICPGCNQELDLNSQNFHVSSSSISGYRNKCKCCVKNDRLSFSRMINKNDLDYFLKEVISGAKTRANRKKIKFGLTMEMLKSLWNKQNGKCAITGLPMTHLILNGRISTNVSIDRIDSNKGYTADNIQLLCVAVNIMKSTMTLDELKSFCKLIIDNN
jgi:hypothetical protein